MGRWRRREGQRVPSSSLQPGPSRHPQLETSVGNGKGRAARGGWEEKKEVDSAHSHRPGMRVAAENLRSLEQDPRSYPSSSRPPDPPDGQD